MRIVFAGTPEFARVALQALDAADFDVALVLTQPDRPAGRGLKLQASPVKAFALERAWPVCQPRSLRLDGKYPDDAQAARAALQATQADAMVVAAYGLILPQWVLDWPRLGCLNIHASLLPRWRGAAPIHRAIEAGDAHTGITIMQMDAGLDTGAMLSRASVPIGAGESTAQLHDRLAALGGERIVSTLRDAAAGRLHATPQPTEGVNYAHKVEKAEAVVQWTWDAPLLVRRICAFDPFPGASTVLEGEPIKLWAAQALPSVQAHADAAGAAPGTVLSADATGVVVAAGQGCVRLTELQRSGGKRLDSASFLRGFDLKVGQVLGA